MPFEKELEKKKQLWNKVALENPMEVITVKDLTWESFVAAGQEDARKLKLWLESQGCQPAQMRVLDIGCGVGRITRFLAEFFAEAHGADISPAMIAKAQELWAGVPNLHFTANSGTDLKIYPDAFFDFVYSVATFLHISKRGIIENYIKEISRVLKPGGYFNLTLNGAKWHPLSLPFGHAYLKLPRFIYNPLVETGILQKIAGLRYFNDAHKSRISQTYLGHDVSLRELEKMTSGCGLKITDVQGVNTSALVVTGRK